MTVTTAEVVMHPGTHIRELLQREKLSIAAGAKEVGFSKSGFENVVYGRTGMNARLAVALERRWPEESAETWLMAQAIWDAAEQRRKEAEEA